MRVIGIVPTEPNNASTMWRITQPFRKLSENDWTTEIYDYTKIDIDYKDAIVILHRIIPGNPKEYVKQFRDSGAKAVLYSVDDYTFSEEALGQYLLHSEAITKKAVEKLVSNVGRQIETMAECDFVICSTCALSNFVQEAIPMRTKILENVIDIKSFQEGLLKKPDTQNQKDKIFVGWAGGRRPQTDLLPMAQAWNMLAQSYREVSFVVGGWQSEVIDSYISLERKIRVPWLPLTEYGRAMQVDIGCCPLEDTLFNQGKSPIKYFEYTMAGAAVVASPTVYKQYNIQAYIARNKWEWYVALEQLLHERRRNAANIVAQESVIKNYSDNTKEWIEFLEGF